jgi:hypothetical protein
VESVQNYLNKAGSNFLVAAFIPSLAFTLTTILFIKPIIPPSAEKALVINLEELNEVSILILVGTAIIGFSLSTLNTFVIKFFEGYVFLWRFPRLKSRHQKEAAALLRNIKKLEKQLDLLPITGKSVSALKRRELHKKLRKFQTQYESQYPHKDNILPTKFGNILKAAETYPLRYGIDSVPIWTRLIHVIPNSYFEKIDNSQNQLSFLVNCSLLSALSGVLFVLVSLYQGLLLILYSIGKPKFLYFIPTNLNIQEFNEIYLQRIFIYMFLFIICLGFTFIFYKASEIKVAHYGNMVRSSFDLFRLKLLKELNI